VNRIEAWVFATLATASLLLAAGCQHGKCLASSAPVHGSDSTCCGENHGYYWTGFKCAEDEACECDAQQARPKWPSLQSCEDANRECKDDLK
jgi:hypothetical protein